MHPTDFRVEITPTAYSSRNDFYLTVRKHGNYGWTTSDLTRSELAKVAHTVINFLANSAIEKELSMRIGFTGSKYTKMRQPQLATFFVLLDELSKTSVEFHHGCNGKRDDQAARIAKCLGYRLYGHPPTDKSVVGTVVNDFDYPELPYLERNHRIVDDTQLLIAAPLTSYEQLRSGTWATVRFAVRRSKPGFVVYPNGQLSELKRTVFA